MVWYATTEGRLISLEQIEDIYYYMTGNRFPYILDETERSKKEKKLRAFVSKKMAGVGHEVRNPSVRYLLEHDEYTTAIKVMRERLREKAIAEGTDMPTLTDAKHAVDRMREKMKMNQMKNEEAV